MDMEASTTRSLSRVLRGSTIRIELCLDDIAGGRAYDPQTVRRALADISASNRKIQAIHAELQRREVLPE